MRGQIKHCVLKVNSDPRHSITLAWWWRFLRMTSLIMHLLYLGRLKNVYISRGVVPDSLYGYCPCRKTWIGNLKNKQTKLFQPT